MCAVGAIYFNDCPVQRFIPIYLLVGGAFSVYANISGLIQTLCHSRASDEGKRVALTIFCKINESLVGCFLLAWFIAGKSLEAYNFQSVIKTVFFVFIQYNIRLMRRSQTATTSNMKQYT